MEWLRLPLGQFMTIIFALESYSNGSMALQFGRTGDNDSGRGNLSRWGGGMGITSEEGHFLWLSLSILRQLVRQIYAPQIC